LKLGIMTVNNRKNWLAFGGRPTPVPDTFPCHSTLRNKRFYEIYLHFSYSHRPIFTTLGLVTDADNIRILHFGSDMANIRTGSGF